MDSGKVLVLGDDTRSFLAIVRSLGRQGVAVHAAPANFRSPALRSRYIVAIHDLPPWIGDGNEWLVAIATLLRAERYDLVIPCDETTLLPLQRHRATLSQIARLAIPCDQAIATLFDKHATRELARRLGVPVAAGRLARRDDTAERLFAEFSAPIVVKPRHSYSLERLAVRGKVEVLGEAARLDRLLGGSDPSESVIEQFFDGRGIGVSVLAQSGRVMQAFEHHRVREVAGASFYRRSAPLTPELSQACEAIVATLKYTGLVMFEFKMSASGRWVILEANARPWGSMPLPLALAVDFPYRWYRLLTTGEETPAVAYPANIYGRNLVPDLRNSLIVAEAMQLGRVATAWLMLQRIAELWRCLAGKEVHDVLVRDDPRPGIVELLDAARSVWRKVSNALASAVARRRRARAQITATRDGAASSNVAFVCLGNICRSPFAAALLRTHLGDSMVSVKSAGTMPVAGRPSPAFAIEAAAAHGVDLSTHRSTWLTRRMVTGASLLIVFDEITRGAVLDRYPDIKVPIVVLGDIVEIGQIADPIDGGGAAFVRAYDQIAKAIAELAPLFCGNHRIAGGRIGNDMALN